MIKGYMTELWLPLRTNMRNKIRRARKKKNLLKFLCFLFKKVKYVIIF